MRNSLQELFRVFFKLGCISFGGPLAALGFFHREFVERKKWVDEKTFMDLVILCQSLPGPVSSQVAIAIGIKEKGIIGGIIALLGFILPSTVTLTMVAYGIHQGIHAGFVHGLMIAVVAVIAQALLMMRNRFCPDTPRMAIALFSTLLALTLTGFLGQICTIIVGALLGARFLRPPSLQNQQAVKIALSKRVAITSWIFFFFFLIAGPIVSIWESNHLLTLFDSFYQTGALVFGGGHVVLALLHTKVVESGLVDATQFLSGYGLVQAMPGPLFCFAAYIGAIASEPPNGWMGALFCTFAIFLPSFLILIGILPLWEKWRHHLRIQTVLSGISAAMWGLLFAAFYDPVWKSSITTLVDFGIALVAFILLEYFKIPQWVIVLLCGLFSAVLFSR